MPCRHELDRRPLRRGGHAEQGYRGDARDCHGVQRHGEAVPANDSSPLGGQDRPRCLPGDPHVCAEFGQQQHAEASDG
jgi:hypothetical protein